MLPSWDRLLNDPSKSCRWLCWTIIVKLIDEIVHLASSPENLILVKQRYYPSQDASIRGFRKGRNQKTLPLFYA